jgi:SAM-dependent methyltransferase
MTVLSPRLARLVAALPLAPGMRVLEIGCGPGPAARAALARLGPSGFLLGIDRSARAIAQAIAGSGPDIAAGRLAFRTVAAEDFARAPGEAPFDLAFAFRVGALDGRHPEAGRRALLALAGALRPGGRLFIDGGDPLGETPLPA